MQGFPHGAVWENQSGVGAYVLESSLLRRALIKSRICINKTIMTDYEGNQS